MRQLCKRFTVCSFEGQPIAKTHTDIQTVYCIYVYITIDDWWHGEDDPVPVIDNRINRFVFYDW